MGLKLNKKRVKELRKFVEVFFPQKVGDKNFFRNIKTKFKAQHGMV